MFVSNQLWKTLDTTDSALLERLTTPDVDVASLFHVDKEQQKLAVDVEKQRLERFETEAFYLNVSTVVTQVVCFTWTSSEHGHSADSSVIHLIK